MLKLLRLVRLIFDNILEFESKRKARAIAFSGGERDASFEFFDDQFWYHQAQANAVYIHVSVVLDEPKELKKLVLVLSRDSDARISNAYFEEPLIFLVADDFDESLNLTLLGKL